MKKHLNERSNRINKKLMESWGYKEKIPLEEYDLDLERRKSAERFKRYISFVNSVRLSMPTMSPEKENLLRTAIKNAEKWTVPKKDSEYMEPSNLEEHDRVVSLARQMYKWYTDYCDDKREASVFPDFKLEERFFDFLKGKKNKKSKEPSPENPDQSEPEHIAQDRENACGAAEYLLDAYKNYWGQSATLE
jgi:hypothetical protein